MRVAEQTRQWLVFDGKIWLDESHDAVAEGIARDELVARLPLVPAGRSSNVKWRWVVGTIVAALVILFGRSRMVRNLRAEGGPGSQARELAAYST